MNRSKYAYIVSILGFSALVAHGELPARSFTVVNNSSGGQYMYAPMPAGGSMPDAVLDLLRQVHAYFGNRPDVGKFIESRDGRSMAAFFNVAAKNPSNKPLTGLLIVTRNADGSGTGAVLFDEQRRFASSEPALMKSLAAVMPGTVSAAAQGSHRPQKLAGDALTPAASSAPPGPGR